MSKRKTTIILSIMSLSIVIALCLFVVLDKYKFSSQYKYINTVVTNLQHSNKIENIKYDKYCTYGHHKYDTHGDLGCSVEARFTTDNDDISTKTVEQLNKIKWRYGRENTSNLLRNDDGEPVKSVAYTIGNLRCNFIERLNNNIFNYYISCYGQALRPWYPVRGL